ncbi:uncharacterized protein YqcC (DUF446 family) [Panacagrimonas perspica]|uniref:Uncharacterized protein YqcC (DUF446 family) n=1 Tax=Panacagrimonas perspica TaxID=381431 RepID=A0A4R7PCJ0_9GAMM|nr:YqcC family protein [Panacagrimonas perspica]TDU30950.1 uncharacterized protein YqcC (DUF446 family) [Panacagrimonas perspica]
MSKPNPAVDAVAKKVEQTMRRLNVWTTPAPPLKPFRQPFAMDAMPFVHWIQLVLVPRLREVARGDGPMPPSSNLAGHAVREFDGDDLMDPLIDVLREVDGLSQPFLAPAPAGRVPSMFALKLAARLGIIVAIVLSISASQWVSRSFSAYFPPHVSAVFFGSIEPDAGHSVLRVALMAERGRENALRPTEAHVLLDRSGMPTPGVLIKLPDPLSFDPTAPPEAAAIRDWLVSAGVDANSPQALPAAAQVLDIVGVAVSARTRQDLETLRPRLPPGTYEPQIVDIDGHTPGWLDMTAGLVVAVAVCIPFLWYAIRVRRRRS